jgi:RecB family exonuclease
VTTFPQLTDALARDLGVPARALGPELAAIVLARALERPGIPEAFRAPGRGLVRQLLGLLGELAAAGLGASEVAEVARMLAGAAGSERLAALARVYAAYEEALDRLGVVDRHGREWRVCQALQAAEAAGTRPRTIAGIRRLVFAEIYDYSILQFLIATSLIRLVGDAELVAFAHPVNVDATRFLERTWNRFVADAAIADQVLPSFVVRGGRAGSLAAALGGTFAAERPAPVAGDGSIRLLRAPGRYREVEAVVGEVRRRLEAGTAPERIALLARDLAPYGELIEDVCRRYRVPVYFRKGRALLSAGVMQLVLSVLRGATEGLPRRRFEAVLDSDYVRTGPPGLSRALRSAGFVADVARPLADCLAGVAATLRPGVGERLLALADGIRALDRPRSVAGHVRALRAALRALRVRPVATADVPVAIARRDALAWTKLDETLVALGGLKPVLGAAPVSLDAFVSILLAALEPQEIEDEADPVGSVRALSVLDARGLDFDVVYLLGLDDGTFPAPRAESALLPDGIRRELNRLAPALVRAKLGPRAEGLPLAGLLRTSRETALEDPFLFFLALSMAERKLVLSWPAVDERGNPAVLSPFVDEVAACLENGLAEENISTADLVPPLAECGEAGELVARAARERWRPAAGAAPDRLAAALRDALPGGAARLAAIDRRALVEERRARYFLTGPHAPGKEALADAFVGRLAAFGRVRGRVEAMEWSPTRLEELGACGFRFFARRMLGLKEETEPDLEVAAHEQGNLLHAILAGFFRAYPRLPARLDDARELARRFLAVERTRLEAEAPARDAHFFDLTWRRLGAAMDELLAAEHEAQTRLVAEGIAVERWLEDPLVCPLEDPDGGPPVMLGGTPDRVELHRQGERVVRVRVVDYKASRDWEKFRGRLRELGRTSFQIPVYTLGALARGPAGLDAGTPCEGGFVVLFAAPERKEQVQALDAPAGFAADIRAVVARARAGRFDVDPDPCDPFCPYRSVCRYEPPPLEEDALHG